MAQAPGPREPAIARLVAWYNFCRVHQTLRVAPAMQAGITDRAGPSRRSWQHRCSPPPKGYRDGQTQGCTNHGSQDGREASRRQASAFRGTKDGATHARRQENRKERQWGDCPSSDPYAAGAKDGRPQGDRPPRTGEEGPAPESHSAPSANRESEGPEEPASATAPRSEPRAAHRSGRRSRSDAIVLSGPGPYGVGGPNRRRGRRSRSS